MIHFKENKNKSALSTRWAQMSKQEQIIEKKKMEIQAKLEAQKQAAALAAQAKLSNPVINEDAGPNIFSNDGSFMSQYKALLEKQTKEKQEKEAKEKQENEEKARIEEEEMPKPEIIVMKEEMDREINDHYNHTPNDRRQDRGSRERHRRWTDRSRMRPHSPITPVIEDRKKIIDTMNIPPLMQLSVRPPDDHSPPPSSIHNPWQSHEGTSSNDEYDPENNSHDNSHDDDCSEPAPVGPGSRGIMGPGPLNPVPMGSVGPGTMRPGSMGFGPMGPGPMSHGPMGPGQMGPGQMGPGQMGPGMGPGSMMSGSMGPGSIRPGHMGANPNMPPGPHQGPGPNMGPGPSTGSGSLMGPGGPNMPPMPPFMSGPPNFNMPPNFMGPNGPCGPGPMPPNMCGPNMRGPGPNGPPPFFPPFNNSQMGNNGPPNSMNSLRFGPHGPNFGSRPPFGPNSSNFGPNNGPPNMGPPHMPFMPPNTMSDPKPLESIPPPEPMKLQNIPQPMPMTLNHIPPPNDMEPGNIPAPNPSQVLSADSFPTAVLRAATEVATNGDHWENVLKAIHSQDQNMWFLHNTNSIEYKAYRDLVHKMRGEGHGVNRKPEVKPEDKYEPEFSLEDDDSNDNRPIKQEYRESNQEYYGTMKREQTSSQSDEDSDNKKERRKRKKSRWGDEPPLDIKPPGVLTHITGALPGATLSKIEEEGMKLTNVNRNNQALMQYAMTNYGTTNLSVEDWKKCEDNFKLNLLYQDMLKKRQEVERLAAAGRHKYDYDSDEDVADGTWEHKLRAKEMNATEKWATELTKQAAGKHHIGDFLPPEELKKFMEKYSAFKSGKEPDFSDYKEYKLKEDNVGFKMLQKLGWNEGQGLGAEGTGIVEPINKSSQPVSCLGLGCVTPDSATPHDDEFDAYRKRMMLAYRFRPNPLNNPRRPYY